MMVARGPDTSEKKNTYVAEIKMSNFLLRSPTNFDSIWSRRIIAALASKIRGDDDSDFEEHEITFAELANLADVRISTDTYKAISEAGNELLSAKMVINDPSKPEITIYNVFSKLVIARNASRHFFMRLKFSDEMRPFLLDVKSRFAMINLKTYSGIRSKFVQRFFEYISSWRGTDSVCISMQHICKNIGIPDYIRNDFTQFRLRVLEPTLQVFKEKEGLSLFYKTKMDGRKVTHLTIYYSEDAVVSEEKAQETKILEDLEKWQRLSNNCYNSHRRALVICTPKKGKKCTYCRTRGHMRFKKISETDDPVKFYGLALEEQKALPLQEER